MNNEECRSADLSKSIPYNGWQQKKTFTLSDSRKSDLCVASSQFPDGKQIFCIWHWIYLSSYIVYNKTPMSLNILSQ